jgi:hypothetical protein
LGGSFEDDDDDQTDNDDPLLLDLHPAEKNGFTLELTASDEFADKEASYYGTALQAATVAGQDTIVRAVPLLAVHLSENHFAQRHYTIRIAYI